MFINKILYYLSSTAAKKGISNTPTEEVFENIAKLDSFIQMAYESWQKYSSLNGIPECKFMIVSGYRSPQLNKSVGGIENSPHTLGYAADVYIKLKSNWFQFCDWMSEFAKECSQKKILFDQIAPESNGNYNWMHISIMDADGNQLMRSIEKPVQGSPFKPVQYGESKSLLSQKTKNDSRIESNQLISEGKRFDKMEIEGQRGETRLDKNELSGSYARCIYIMRKLMKNLGLRDYQAAGILGNLLDDTNGRLSTTISHRGYSGISRWTSDDQIRYRNMFMNDESLVEGTLLNQVSFLIHDLNIYKLVPKIQRTRTFNESCMRFYESYERFGEKYDPMDIEIRKECSRRRGYSKSALEIYKNYSHLYKEEWLMGYYRGNGVEDGKPVEIGDDTKIWNSKDKKISLEELNQYAQMITDEANKIYNS